MNRILTTILVLASWSVFAQQSRPVVFREETFDYGTVKEDGGPVDHDFIFTNITNRPVRIVSVQPSCGCTTPEWTKEAVAPGSTGFIRASYNPKGRPGYFNKTLTVTTDADPNSIVLQIKGTVSTPGGNSDAEFKVQNGNWKLRHSSFNLGKVHRTDAPTIRDFPYINTGTKPVSVVKVIAPAYINAELTPKTLKPGEKGNIKMQYYGMKRNAYGFQSDNIEIHTDDAENPVKSFTVLATLEDHFPEMKPEEYTKAPRLQLGASSLDFGRVQQNSTVVREVNFTNTGKKELEIRAVQGNCTCITAVANDTKLKPGESTTLRISFNTEGRKSTQNKAVLIYSNDPRNPVQRITFTAYVVD